jgi:hypothetical protein
MDPGHALKAFELSPNAQYAIDEGFVTCARFIDQQVSKANSCAEAYRKGDVVLIPQIVAHNVGGIPPMKYEVGALVCVPEAGSPGLNGCVKGIHVHMDEQSAVNHAQQMSVQRPEADVNSKNILPQVIEVKEEPWSRLHWKRWNPSTTSWPREDTLTACVACLRELGGRRFVSMSCGHGFYCNACAELQREAMTCVVCEADAVRISALHW